MIVRAWGAIWFNPFTMVLFNVCIAVIVEFCFVPVLHGYVCCYVKNMAFFLVFLQLLSRGIWAYMRCPCLCLCWAWGWGLFKPTSIYVVLCCVKSSFKRDSEEYQSNRAYVF